MLFKEGKRAELELGLIEQLIDMRVYPMINVFLNYTFSEEDATNIKIKSIIFFFNGFVKPEKEYYNRDNVICEYQLKDYWYSHEDKIRNEIISATLFLKRKIKEKLLKEEE